MQQQQPTVSKTTSNSNIRAVVFDVDNTLCDQAGLGSKRTFAFPGLTQFLFKILDALSIDIYVASSATPKSAIQQCLKSAGLANIVDDKHINYKVDKLDVLKSIPKLQNNQILLVDDYKKVCDQAKQQGYRSVHVGDIKDGLFITTPTHLLATLQHCTSHIGKGSVFNTAAYEKRWDCYSKLVGKENNVINLFKTYLDGYKRHHSGTVRRLYNQLILTDNRQPKNKITLIKKFLSEAIQNDPNFDINGSLMARSLYALGCLYSYSELGKTNALSPAADIDGLTRKNSIGGEHRLSTKLWSLSFVMNREKSHGFIVLEGLNERTGQYEMFEAHLGQYRQRDNDNNIVLSHKKPFFDQRYVEVYAGPTDIQQIEALTKRDYATQPELPNTVKRSSSLYFSATWDVSISEKNLIMEQIKLATKICLAQQCPYEEAVSEKRRTSGEFFAGSTVGNTTSTIISATSTTMLTITPSNCVDFAGYLLSLVCAGAVNVVPTSSSNRYQINPSRLEKFVAVHSVIKGEDIIEENNGCIMQ